MGSLNKPLSESVPIIDLSEVFADFKNANKLGLSLKSPSVAKLVEEVRDACTQWGFFYIVGHQVDSEFLGELRKVSMDFFQKSKDFKDTIRRKPNNFRGFADNELTKQKLDLKETFDFGFEINDGIDFDAGQNQWPEDMPQFRATLSKYFSSMQSVSLILMDLIFMSLGADPTTMKHNFSGDCSASFCRLNYYPASPNSKDGFGVGPHSDAGLLTVLLQDDNVSSLQVEKDGKFHAVPPVPGSFVINIGDMMQVWSNGRYKAPVHRVLSNPAKERFSVPFFFNPSYDTDVKPLPQCISNASPARYRPVNWGHFRQTRILGNYADHGEEIQIYMFEIKE